MYKLNYHESGSTTLVSALSHADQLGEIAQRNLTTSCETGETVEPSYDEEQLPHNELDLPKVPIAESRASSTPERGAITGSPNNTELEQAALNFEPPDMMPNLGQVLIDHNACSRVERPLLASDHNFSSSSRRRTAGEKRN